MNKLPGYLLPVLTGVLLILSFPTADISFLAWFALVPLLYRVLRSAPGVTAGAFWPAFGCAAFGSAGFCEARTGAPIARARKRAEKRVEIVIRLDTLYLPIG